MKTLERHGTEAVRMHSYCEDMYTSWVAFFKLTVTTDLNMKPKPQASSILCESQELFFFSLEAISLYKGTVWRECHCGSMWRYMFD